jgi:hypothetical protein
MSMEILQHAVVTLVALAASAVLVRRGFGFVEPRAGRTGCAGCPSAQGACRATTQATSGATVQHPAVLIPTSALVRRQTSRTPRRAGSIGRLDPS